MCTNCSSDPATPAHILKCLGLTKQDLADVPLLVLDFLKVGSLPQINLGVQGIQENGTGRRRSNLELCLSYKEYDIVNFIKVQRIKWADHVVRMEEDRTTKLSSMPNQLTNGIKVDQILDGLMA
ncbi:hypothetical protein TNCV_4984121 [Trichonephila clavipes]|nr:hypothetical protein TNCV_4984121 [Trichonephila clavipes]